MRYNEVTITQTSMGQQEQEGGEQGQAALRKGTQEWAGMNKGKQE